MDHEEDQVLIVTCREAVGEAYVRRASPQHRWFQATVKQDESQRRRLDEAVRQVVPNVGFNGKIRDDVPLCVHDTYHLMHLSSLP